VNRQGRGDIAVDQNVAGNRVVLSAQTNPLSQRPVPLSALSAQSGIDGDLMGRLDGYSLESVVEFKISRFLDQLGGYYPPSEDLHDMIMQKVEKPLLVQILKRMGGNQVAASRVLGINRNTLRKKMKMYGL
jgi:DNA-binding protein Fis